MTSVTFTLDLLRYEFFPKIDLLDLICFKSVCTLWCKEIEETLEHYWTALLNDTADYHPQSVFEMPTGFYLNLAAKKMENVALERFSEEEKKHKAANCFQGLFIFCQLKWNDSLCELQKNYPAIGLRIKYNALFFNEPHHNLKGKKLAFAAGTNSLIGIVNLNERTVYGYFIRDPDALGQIKYFMRPTWLGFGKPATYDQNGQLVNISFDIKTFEEVFGSKAENSQTCCGCFG